MSLLMLFYVDVDVQCPRVVVSIVYVVVLVLGAAAYLCVCSYCCYAS
jgi:hypothetical protein